MKYSVKHTLLILLLLVSSVLSAQNIKILDTNTNLPIVGVALYNKAQTKTAISNLDGIVSITNFNAKETIYFQHIAYQLKSLKKTLLAIGIIIGVCLDHLDTSRWSVGPSA